MLRAFVNIGNADGPINSHWLKLKLGIGEQKLFLPEWLFRLNGHCALTVIVKFVRSNIKQVHA